MFSDGNVIENTTGSCSCNSEGRFSPWFINPNINHYKPFHFYFITLILLSTQDSLHTSKIQKTLICLNYSVLQCMAIMSFNTLDQSIQLFKKAFLLRRHYKSIWFESLVFSNLMMLHKLPVLMQNSVCACVYVSVPTNDVDKLNNLTYLGINVTYWCLILLLAYHFHFTSTQHSTLSNKVFL